LFFAAGPNGLSSDPAEDRAQPAAEPDIDSAAIRTADAARSCRSDSKGRFRSMLSAIQRFGQPTNLLQVDRSIWQQAQIAAACTYLD
jgi:hypothetical protein